MAHDARIGLATVPSADGITPSYRDADQWVRIPAATRTALAARFGGPGLVLGGAAEVTELAGGGTRYPASSEAPLLLTVADDSGYAYWFLLTAEAPIQGLTALADGTTAAVYAVIGKVAGVSPAMAAGGPANVVFLAQNQAAPPPGDSLLLGTGTVGSGSLTTWTEAAGVRLDGFTVGTGKDNTITVTFATGAETPPGLRYSPTSEKVEVSHDGATWTEIGSGGAIGNPLEVEGTDPAVHLIDPDTNTAQLERLATGGVARLRNTVHVPNIGSDPGGAIDFEAGSSQYGIVPNDAAFQFASAFSIMGWIKLESCPSNHQILSKNGNAGYRLRVINDAGTNKLSFLGAYVNSVIVEGGDLALDTWYHVAMLTDGSSTELYVNGSQVATGAAYSPADATSGDVEIGNCSTYGELFDGLIDDLQVYNAKLDPADVTADYDSGAGVYAKTAGGLAAHWRFDEGTGTTAYDTAAGADHDCALQNAPAWAVGKVDIPADDGVDELVEALRSEDGVEDDEKGIHTLGNANGRSVVKGWRVDLTAGAQTASITENIAEHLLSECLVVDIDGGGAEIADAEHADIYIPFDCQIVGWVLLAHETGSIVIDVWKDVLANFPPTVADTITVGGEPTITTAEFASSENLAAWTTTTCAAGEVIRLNVDSCTDIQRVTVILRVVRV